ncbi:MAG TPA: hypothetical protein VI814_09720 [Candidatus Limnocylindria bacterium]
MDLARISLDLESLAPTVAAGSSSAVRRRAEWLVAQACDAFGDAEEGLRRDLLHTVARQAVLRALFCNEIGRAAIELERDPSPRALRRGLFAALLAEGVREDRWKFEVARLRDASLRLPAMTVDALWDDACEIASAGMRALLRAEHLLRRRSVPLEAHIEGGRISR